MLWYKIPGSPSIECDKEGNIRSSTTHKLRKQQQRCGKPGQKARRWIDVREPGEPRRKPYVSRLVLSAKLGRKLERWEDARHINGNHADNSMDNLEVGCRLNNVIDDFENGLLVTSVEQIDKAIARLEELKRKIT